VGPCGTDRQINRWMDIIPFHRHCSTYNVGSAKKTRVGLLLWAHAGTDRRMDIMLLHRPCSTYYAGSDIQTRTVVNKLIVSLLNTTFECDVLPLRSHDKMVLLSVSTSETSCATNSSPSALTLYVLSGWNVMSTAHSFNSSYSLLSCLHLVHF